MSHVGFYHRETGAIHQVDLQTSDDSIIAANTPADHIAIKQPAGGRLDHLSQRVDIATGEVIDYQPPAPSAGHAWDQASRRWILGPTGLAALNAHNAALHLIARAERASLRALREAVLDLAVHAGITLPELAAAEAAIKQHRQAILPTAST